MFRFINQIIIINTLVFNPKALSKHSFAVHVNNGLIPSHDVIHVGLQKLMLMTMPIEFD